MEPAKICLIVVYFGKWPNYMPYFMRSLAANPTIDFIFFTNNDSINSAAGNVKTIPFTLDEFNELASRKLAVDVRVSEPYKLCDFKPMYGRIFEDHLGNYAFWGYCDIDVVFGNIRKFITPDLLEKYDVICARKEFLCGHFTIFKNTEQTKSLYKESADHEKVITEPSYCYSFDECGRIWPELLKGRSIWDCEAPIDSMTHVVKRLALNEGISVYFETLVTEPDKHIEGTLEMEAYTEELVWNNGTLTSLTTKKEFMHFHANILKHWRHFSVPFNERLPDKFYINERGFIIAPLKKALKSLGFYSAASMRRKERKKEKRNNIKRITP